MNTPNSKLIETVAAILEERAGHHERLAEKAAKAAYKTLDNLPRHGTYEDLGAIQAHDKTFIDSKMAEANYHIGEVKRHLVAAENLREAGEHDRRTHT